MNFVHWHWARFQCLGNLNVKASVVTAAWATERPVKNADSSCQCTSIMLLFQDVVCQSRGQPQGRARCRMAGHGPPSASDHDCCHTGSSSSHGRRPGRCRQWRPGSCCQCCAVPVGQAGPVTPPLPGRRHGHGLTVKVMISNVVRVAWSLCTTGTDLGRA